VTGVQTCALPIYLNKMEGDSLMFHYGGLIDPNSRDLSQDELEIYLARELFYTCIEMQKACSFFNEADKRFITENTDQETREHLQAAFLIISTLRENLVFASAINALFQIKIRVGASIGEVCIGNFGPQGAKQWDIIGNPVIEAKRMEMTAPVEGIRISENFYKILEKTGISEQYFREFKEEAERTNGYFRDITKEELFRFREVRIKEKKNIRFNTYKVFVNPGLPETIAKHVEALLFKQEDGADKIIEIIQYNRGCKHVMEAVEDLFAGRKIGLNKPDLLKIVLPRKHAELLQQRNGDCESLNAYINRRFSLFDLVNVLSMYQDCMHTKMENREKRKTTFSDYDQYLAEEIHRIHMNYKAKKKTFDQNVFFWQVAYPSFFMVIKAGVIDYQKRIEESEPVEIAV
jgi:adenylate cyclase